ncbi:hypothetical protein [Thalassotalea crassostreae]|uniref:hypothetical protein n=1 Tax=Thalassotalea crassostreae TaxID=1763536 RepID=UPI0012FD606D|nr:hypothetical protein [Thalassotalea crassostreae]
MSDKRKFNKRNMNSYKKKLVDILWILIPLVCLALYLSNILGEEQESKKMLYDFFIEEQEQKIAQQGLFYKQLKDIEHSQKAISDKDKETLKLTIQLYESSIKGYLNNELSEKAKSNLLEALEYKPSENCE